MRLSCEKHQIRIKFLSYLEVQCPLLTPYEKGLGCSLDVLILVDLLQRMLARIEIEVLEVSEGQLQKNGSPATAKK